MEQGLQPMWRNDSRQVTSPSTTTLAADIPAHLKSRIDVKRTLTSLENYGARVSTLAANMLSPKLLKCGDELVAEANYKFIPQRTQPRDRHLNLYLE